MKVMISQPMNGLSIEQVKANRKAVIEMLEAKGHEVVDTVIAETPPEIEYQALWYLGKALELMAQCDACVFMKGWDAARGCRIEHAAALAYGVEVWMENGLPEVKRTDND